MTAKEIELEATIGLLHDTIDEKNREIFRLNSRIWEMLELIDKISDTLKG